MALYDPVDGVYRKVSKKYDPVDGVYRKVKAAYDPVDGVYRQYFSGGLTVGELPIGTIFSLLGNIYKVVHQGNPDPNLYDESCNGTWLLNNHLGDSTDDKEAWGKSTKNYGYDASSIHTDMNSGNFSSSLYPGHQEAIKQVKIPYTTAFGSTSSVAPVSSGANGLSARFFLPSAYELGWTNSNHERLPVDGACLDYFSGLADVDEKRIANYGYGLSAQAGRWWTRSQYQHNNLLGGFVFAVGENGSLYELRYSSSNFRRAACIIDSNTQVSILEGTSDTYTIA